MGPMTTENGNAAHADVAWPQVTLGDYTYSVVPQRIGRLKKRLGRELESLASIDLDAGFASFAATSLDKAHALLKVFIPDLMPMWEFMGYRSQEAMEADDLPDDGKEYGPDVPQIIDAFQRVMEVNRLDLFKHLGNVVSPDLLRAYINKQMASMMLGEETEPSPTTS